MLPTWLLWIFRLIHILSGVFWVGAILMFARFFFPAAQALGPAAGPVMDHMTRVGKLPAALLGAALSTAISGLVLYWNDSMGFKSAWMSSPTGTVFGLGGLLAITAIVIGATVNSPTAQKMGVLAGTIHSQGSPPTPDQLARMKQLQGKLGAALRVVAVLLVLATAAMALARYVT